MDKSKNFEKSVPENYVLVKHVDAKNDKKQASTYSILSLIPLLVIVPFLCIFANYHNGYNLFKNWNADKAYLVFLIAFAVDIAYVVLHELTHGITYKICTGGKLTFGYAITIAFCGVPDLYVRKKAAVLALIMPFTVFGIVFTSLTIVLWQVKVIYGIAAGFVLALHIGGCFGDLHWTLMYLTKFKRCNTLMRDVGPEQWLYIPKEEAEKYGIPVIEIPENKTEEK